MMERHHHNSSTTDFTELFVSPKSDSSSRVIPLVLETELTFGRHEQLGETKPCLNFQRRNVDDW